MSCTNEKSNETNLTSSEINVIAPPLAGEFQNDTLFIIDPSIENWVETPNGSSITVPANSLVDANGNNIEDNVELSFTQYHSITDIMTSGIPMRYDTLGESYSFESAGMFTLDARANDQAVFIKDNESINVSLASDKDEAFNFYELNEQTGDWTYEFNDKPVENSKYDASKFPMEPETANEDAFVLDISFDLSNYSELNVFSSVVWEYTGNEDSLNPEKNSWISKTKWTEFDLEPTGDKAYEYYLTMSNKKESFTTQVKASLSGDDFDLALGDFKDKKLEVAKVIDNLQKPFVNSVQISGFGTYNYDYIHQMAEPQEILADFNFGDQNDSKEKSMVFVLYEEEDVCVNYPHSMWNNFALDKSSQPKVLAILPDNRIAIYDKDVSGSYGKSEFTFDMTVLDQKIENKNSLLDVIHNM